MAPMNQTQFRALPQPHAHHLLDTFPLAGLFDISTQHFQGGSWVHNPYRLRDLSGLLNKWQMISWKPCTLTLTRLPGNNWPAYREHMPHLYHHLHESTIKYTDPRSMKNPWLNKNAFYNNTNKILSTFIIFMVIRRSLTPENRKRLLTKPHIKFLRVPH